MGFPLHDLYMYAAPGNLLVLGLVVSLIGVLLKRDWGTVTLSVCTAAAVIICTWPIGNMMMVPLEQRFPVLDPLPAHVDGIVVLGGAVRLNWSYRVGLPPLNKRAERMTETLVLARRYPNARIVFTGGNRSRISEADVARLFFQQQGLDLSRVTFEDRSHSTFDNAVLTKALVNPKPGETWILITSANHMPRAVGSFRKAGWHVVPCPVDFREGRYFTLAPSYSFGDNLDKFNEATREWVALLTYYLRGRTDALFPAPWNGRGSDEQASASK